MKKLITLFLAAGMLLTSVAGASAVEFKPSGNIDFGLFFTNNMVDNKFLPLPAGPANDSPVRYRMQMAWGMDLDFVASEQLSGGFSLDGGVKTFGGAWEDNLFTVDTMYLDWYVPNTPVQVRMGRFGQGEPVFAFGRVNPLGTSDGVRLTAQINDMFSVIGYWGRPADKRAMANGAYGDWSVNQFFLSVPVTLDGIKFTPWFTYTRNHYGSEWQVPGGSWSALANAAQASTWAASGNTTTPDGAVPGVTVPVTGPGYANPWAGFEPADFGDPGVPANVGKGVWDSSQAWTIGIGGEISKFSPFTFAFDFGYSSYKFDGVKFNVLSYNADTGALVPTTYYGLRGDNTASFNRAGWLLAGSFAYKTDWGTPTLKAWYTSGDDANISNGSERPFAVDVSSSGTYALFGDNSQLRRGINGAFEAAGTWGLSVQWNAASFLTGLTHNVAFSYIKGTNDPFMAAFHVPVVRNTPRPDLAQPWNYMTKNDSAWALELRNVYKIYSELTLAFDMFYIWEKFDGATWDKVWDPTVAAAPVDANFGQRVAGTAVPQFANSWGVGLSFRYAF